MRLFTYKKYDFLIEKNLPSLPASHPISRPIGSEIEFIFPATQNQGGGRACFTTELSEFRRIYLRIQILVGKVMVESSVTLVSLWTSIPFFFSL